MCAKFTRTHNKQANFFSQTSASFIWYASFEQLSMKWLYPVLICMFTTQAINTWRGCNKLILIHAACEICVRREMMDTRTWSKDPRVHDKRFWVPRSLVLLFVLFSIPLFCSWNCIPLSDVIADAAKPPARLFNCNISYTVDMRVNLRDEWVCASDMPLLSILTPIPFFSSGACMLLSADTCTRRRLNLHSSESMHIWFQWFLTSVARYLYTSWISPAGGKGNHDDDDDQNFESWNEIANQTMKGTSKNKKVPDGFFDAMPVVVVVSVNEGKRSAAERLPSKRWCMCLCCFFSASCFPASLTSCCCCCLWSADLNEPLSIRNWISHPRLCEQRDGTTRKGSGIMRGVCVCEEFMIARRESLPRNPLQCWLMIQEMEGERSKWESMMAIFRMRRES